MYKVSQAMYCHLVSPDREVQNVTEWAKREVCWKKAKSISIPLGSMFKKELVSTTEDTEARKMPGMSRSRRTVPLQ